MPALHVPSATYRLQFNKDFGFADAAGLLPYLDALGISDVYASPLTEARPAAPTATLHHPLRLNPELGPLTLPVRPSPGPPNYGGG